MVIDQSEYYDFMTYKKKEFYDDPTLLIDDFPDCSLRYSRSPKSRLFCDETLLPLNGVNVESLYREGFMRKNANVTN